MRITRIALKNLFQHADLEVPIVGNTIGIIGRNGQGKSNFLHSLRFALTGEIPADYVKEDMVYHGAEGAPSYVEVDFVHDGVECTVHRSAAGSDTWLKIRGREIIEGIRSVNKELNAFTGLHPDIARYAFVNQKELDAALFAAASQREQAFQRLCGLSEAQTIRDSIRLFSAQRLPDIPDYPKLIAQAQGELPALQKAADDAKVAFERTPEPGSMEAAQQAANKAAALTSLIPAIEAHSGHAAAIPALEADAAAKTANAASLEAEIAAIDIVTLEGSINTRQSTLNRLSAAQAAFARLEALERSAADLANTPVQIAEQEAWLARVRPELATATAQMNELRGVYTRDQALVEALRRHKPHGTPGDVCPTCQQPIADPGATLAALEAKQATRSAELAAVVATVKSIRNPMERAETWVAQARAAVIKFSEDLTRAQAAVAHLDRSTLGNADNLAAALAQDQAQKQRWVQLKHTHLQAASAAQAAEIRRIGAVNATTAARATLDAAEARLRDILGAEPMPGSVDALRALADATLRSSQSIRQAAAAYEQLRANVGLTAQARDRLVAQIEQLRRDAEGSTVIVATRTLLNKAEEWFHYRNGPSALAMHVLHKLNADLNTMLKRMNVPFRATAEDSSLTYSCVFTDGRPQPVTGGILASKLSGGQKGMLAVAFRLAVFRMFASKIGLLSLDEPTAYLDDANVSNFCAALDDMRGIAGDMDTQMFMSTHERQLMGHLDTVVQL